MYLDFAGRVRILICKIHLKSTHSLYWASPKLNICDSMRECTLIFLGESSVKFIYMWFTERVHRAFAGQTSTTEKPVLSGHSKIDKTKILMTNGSLMKVERIAECSLWSILKYF